MKITVLTLGCKTNLAESDYIKSTLLERGHKLVDLKDNPDICIINTCTVTKKADYQCRQLIRRALKSDAEVFVTGCYSEIFKNEVSSISSDIRIVKNLDKDNIINMIDSNTESILSGLCRSDRARPFVKIQEGCNFRCSYCVIHRARGRSKSRPIEYIIEEIQALEFEGFDEVVLTGTHIGLYGIDIYGKTNLTQLIKEILINTERIRVRLSSLEINEIDTEVIELLNEQRIRPHLHIPVQSADNSILTKMRRPYNINILKDKLKVIYNLKRDINIGTDIIVGFPGEGEREFLNTYNFLKDHAFNYIHIFPYSDRPGTEASMMKKKIPEVIKKERYEHLKMLDESKRRLYREKQIGRIIEVISERIIEKSMIKGKSENYLDVLFKTKEFQRGKTLKVKILKQSDGVLIGKPINELKQIEI